MGEAKSLLRFGGETMLARVVRILGTAASPVVVVAAPGQDLPVLSREVAIARDAARGRGPLQGIKAGLETIAAAADAVFVAPTDVPFLEPAFVRRMAALLTGNFDAVTARVAGHTHPLCAVYACTILPVTIALLAENKLAVRLLADHVRTRVVDERELLQDAELLAADPELRSLRNVNTREQYAAAHAEAERGHLPQGDRMDDVAAPAGATSDGADKR